MRVLLDPDAPASAGGHRPVRIVAPEGSLLNAQPPAAVAAGNVETSSRVADLVLAALGEAADGPAQGQGTMNNVTLAGDSFTYYETSGGGQGACADADGPDAVHVAMSNTLNTPIEALESELPLRVRELSIRRGSGGAGLRHGGDGMVREIEALEPMRFTLLTERRRHAPRGRDGGGDGAPGRNLLNGRGAAREGGGHDGNRRPAADRDAWRRRPRSPAITRIPGRLRFATSLTNLANESWFRILPRLSRCPRAVRRDPGSESTNPRTNPLIP